MSAGPALAAELAGEYHLALGNITLARGYLHTAYFTYQEWGSSAKLADLEERYPEWLPPSGEADLQPGTPAALSGHPGDEINTSVDMNTILQTSLELAQETNLENLLRKLMLALIENAGAQIGTLVLRREDSWYIEIQGSRGIGQEFSLCSTPLEAQPADACPIPASLIHYVINLQAALVLEDASASQQFNQDAYVRERRPKSILCAPLLHQGVLYGVIYLENNLTTGAFTADRLEIVRLIAGQAAGLIENTRLYATLEARVEERTRQLSEANLKLKEEIEERNRVAEALHYNEALAALAVTELVDRAAHRRGDLARAVRIALEQVKCHALRRLRADARQATQRLDEAAQRRRIEHARLGVSRKAA